MKNLRSVKENELLNIKKELESQKKKLKEQNEILVKSENRNKAILGVIPDLMFIYDSDGRFVDCQANDKLNLLLDKSEFIGKYIVDIMPESVGYEAMNCIRKTLENGELQSFEYLLSISGETKYFETRMVKSSNVEVLAIVRDITYQRKEKDLIRKLSYEDSLTGVFNRRYFDEYMSEIEEYIPISLMMLDVNGLKLMNDAFGHLVGDQLLKSVTNILKTVCPSDSVICRVGGDEFVVIILDIGRDECECLVDSIYENANSKLVNNISISVSIGCHTRSNYDISVRDMFIRAENNMFKNKVLESQSMRHNTVTAIMKTLNEKNIREKNHSEQVSQISGKIAEAMKLSSRVVKKVEMAGLLHDIGKIVVRDDLLNKPGKLTEEEYDEIKRHSEIGYQILKSVDSYASIADDILSHHERYDGQGYPRGLSGNEIPMIARIIAVADAYEAMISDRSYRKGMPKVQAIEEIKRCSGTQFDPEVVKTFLEIHQLL